MNWILLWCIIMHGVHIITWYNSRGFISWMCNYTIKKMKKELTDEERKVVVELLSKINTRCTDESIEKVVKKIVKLSDEGLKEEEIIEQIKDDVVVLDADGAAAVKRMQDCM